MILDINAFQRAVLSQVPFEFAMLNNLIPPTKLIDLFQNIPLQALDLTQRQEGSDKTYNLYNCLLLDHVNDCVNADIQLADNWRMLIEDFSSIDYKSAMSELLHMNVNHCHIQIMLKVYKAGSFISMHTDDAEVALTHLLFLNPYYDFKNQGNLFFHDKVGNKVVSFPPNANISVLFPRTEYSLHSVDPCHSDEFPKITLQVVFWKTRKQRNLSGRKYL